MVQPLSSFAVDKDSGKKDELGAVFKVSGSAQLENGKIIDVDELELTKCSRIEASGEAGRVALKLLLGELELVEDQSSRCLSQSVRVLSPGQLADKGLKHYHNALADALKSDQQILVVEECLDEKDDDWSKCFNAFIQSSKLNSFAGALLVCTSNEGAGSLAHLCSDSWLMVGSSSRLKKEPYLEPVENALHEKAASDLLEEAMNIDYCDLKYWINEARKTDKDITLFATRGADDKKVFTGFMCHHMIEANSELHIQFIFVPRPLRGSGIGARLVRWIIGKAARMPKSDCKWVSLDAATDDLAGWYEKFGFFDMTCGHDDDPDANVWMEMPNASLVQTPLNGRSRSSTLDIIVGDEVDEVPLASRRGAIKLSFSRQVSSFSRQVSGASLDNEQPLFVRAVSFERQSSSGSLSGSRTGGYNNAVGEGGTLKMPSSPLKSPLRSPMLSPSEPMKSPLFSAKDLPSWVRVPSIPEDDDDDREDIEGEPQPAFTRCSSGFSVAVDEDAGEPTSVKRVSIPRGLWRQVSEDCLG